MSLELHRQLRCVRLLRALCAQSAPDALSQPANAWFVALLQWVVLALHSHVDPWGRCSLGRAAGGPAQPGGLALG